mgnify:CR=1 FL=1
MKKYITSVFIISLFLSACTSQTTSSQNTQTPVETSRSSSTVQSSPNTESSRYVEYSEQNFASNKDKKRVLFFHAAWCPTCQAANKEITANLSSIPSDVILLITDYDTQKELKKKYNITYQHTFVLVDSSGNEIQKWNGGAIKELIAKTK